MAAPMGTRIGTTSRIGGSSLWLLLVFGLLLAAEAAAAAVKVEDTRLIQLHVLWRHGNRTRVRADTYSTDPYKGVPDPNGVGNLNRNGLIKAYELGQALRRRYDTFLGPDYLPNIHRVRSTDKRRTGDSAMLVMAGLFPPGPKEKWHSTGVGVIGRLWQPIDIDMPRLRTDNLLATIDQDCPPLWAAHQAARVSEEVHQDELKVSQNGRIFEYVSVNSGDHINDSYIMQGVHNALLCEEDQGWELPAWTLPVYPEPLRTLSGIGLGLFGRTKQLQRLVAGPFLHHLINASEHAGDADAPKFLGYSGHDNNLVALMGAFGLKDLSNTMPKYSADLAWEVRQDSLTNATYIRILYEGEELRLPACNLESLCTLQQLKESLSDVIVTREQHRKECKP